MDGARAEAGEFAFGTVDIFLQWRLTGGRVHATDAANASRTSLYDLRTGDQDLGSARSLPGSAPGAAGGSPLRRKRMPGSIGSAVGAMRCDAPSVRGIGAPPTPVGDAPHGHHLRPRGGQRCGRAECSIKMTNRRLASITFYPLKSAAGVDLDASRIEARGLAGERRWMVVDPEGKCLTGREHPRIVLVRARIGDDGLRLEATGYPPVTVARAGARPVTIRGADTLGIDAGDEAASWLSALLEAPVRLVEMTDDCFRSPDPDEWADQRARYMTLESIAPMSDHPTVGLPAMAV